MNNLLTPNGTIADFGAARGTALYITPDNIPDEIKSLDSAREYSYRSKNITTAYLTYIAQKMSDINYFTPNALQSPDNADVIKYIVLTSNILLANKLGLDCKLAYIRIGADDYSKYFYNPANVADPNSFASNAAIANFPGINRFDKILKDWAECIDPAMQAEMVTPGVSNTPLLAVVQLGGVNVAYYSSDNSDGKNIRFYPFNTIVGTVPANALGITANGSGEWDFDLNTFNVSMNQYPELWNILSSYTSNGLIGIPALNTYIASHANAVSDPKKTYGWYSNSVPVISYKNAQPVNAYEIPKNGVPGLYMSIPSRNISDMYLDSLTGRLGNMALFTAATNYHDPANYDLARYIILTSNIILANYLGINSTISYNNLGNMAGKKYYYQSDNFFTEHAVYSWSSGLESLERTVNSWSGKIDPRMFAAVKNADNSEAPMFAVIQLDGVNVAFYSTDRSPGKNIRFLPMNSIVGMVPAKSFGIADYGNGWEFDLQSFEASMNIDPQLWNVLYGYAVANGMSQLMNYVQKTYPGVSPLNVRTYPINIISALGQLPENYEVPADDTLLPVIPAGQDGDSSGSIFYDALWIAHPAITVVTDTSNSISILYLDVPEDCNGIIEFFYNGVKIENNQVGIQGAFNTNALTFSYRGLAPRPIVVNGNVNSTGLIKLDEETLGVLVKDAAGNPVIERISVFSGKHMGMEKDNYMPTTLQFIHMISEKNLLGGLDFKFDENTLTVNASLMINNTETISFSKTYDESAITVEVPDFVSVFPMVDIRYMDNPVVNKYFVSHFCIQPDSSSVRFMFNDQTISENMAFGNMKTVGLSRVYLKDICVEKYPQYIEYDFGIFEFPKAQLITINQNPIVKAVVGVDVGSRNSIVATQIGMNNVSFTYRRPNLVGVVYGGADINTDKNRVDDMLSFLWYSDQLVQDNFTSTLMMYSEAIQDVNACAIKSSRIATDLNVAQYNNLIQSIDGNGSLQDNGIFSNFKRKMDANIPVEAQLFVVEIAYFMLLNCLMGGANNININYSAPNVYLAGVMSQIWQLALNEVQSKLGLNINGMNTVNVTVAPTAILESEALFYNVSQVAFAGAPHEYSIVIDGGDSTYDVSYIHSPGGSNHSLIKQFSIKYAGKNITPDTIATVASKCNPLVDDFIDFWNIPQSVVFGGGPDPYEEYRKLCRTLVQRASTEQEGWMSEACIDGIYKLIEGVGFNKLCTSDFAMKTRMYIELKVRSLFYVISQYSRTVLKSCNVTGNKLISSYIYGGTNNIIDYFMDNAEAGLGNWFNTFINIDSDEASAASLNVNTVVHKKFAAGSKKTDLVHGIVLSTSGTNPVNAAGGVPGYQFSYNYSHYKKMIDAVVGEYNNAPMIFSAIKDRLLLSEAEFNAMPVNQAADMNKIPMMKEQIKNYLNDRTNTIPDECCCDLYTMLLLIDTIEKNI